MPSNDHKKSDIYNALKEALRLMSHYAKLLNMHDGGKRKVPITADKWIERINELKAKV